LRFSANAANPNGSAQLHAARQAIYARAAFCRLAHSAETDPMFARRRTHQATLWREEDSPFRKAVSNAMSKPGWTGEGGLKAMLDPKVTNKWPSAW
jgi:hypothetical protein